jgi:hypothetical protein
MKYSLIVLSLFILTSCGKTFSEEEIAKINGYWEIEKVVMPDSTKQYTASATIDYFEVKGKEGFRKKVMPQMDGTYRMNNLLEKIKIVEDSGRTFISYTTDYAKWNEEILTLSEDELVLKNDHDMEYHYKKPQPFTIK